MVLGFWGFGVLGVGGGGGGGGVLGFAVNASSNTSLDEKYSSL